MTRLVAHSKRGYQWQSTGNDHLQKGVDIVIKNFIQVGQLIAFPRLATCIVANLAVYRKGCSVIIPAGIKLEMMEFTAT